MLFFSGESGVSEDRDREIMSPDLLSDTPPVPPRRRDRKRHTPPRPISNGLPPTPKVHMGACFSKVSLQFFSRKEYTTYLLMNAPPFIELIELNKKKFCKILQLSQLRVTEILIKEN